MIRTSNIWGWLKEFRNLEFKIQNSESKIQSSQGREIGGGERGRKHRNFSFAVYKLEEKNRRITIDNTLWLLWGIRGSNSHCGIRLGLGDS